MGIVLYQEQKYVMMAMMNNMMDAINVNINVSHNALNVFKEFVMNAILMDGKWTLT